MRKLLSILVLLATLGCTKSSVQRVSETGLIGKWEIRARQAGMIIGSTFPAGNGHTLEFTDNTFTEMDSGRVIHTGSYTIQRESTVDNQTCTGAGIDSIMNRIIYDPATSDMKTFLVVSGDTLSFYSGCFAVDSGVFVRFERISN
jgi:hypothetical protein